MPVSRGLGKWERFIMDRITRYAGDVDYFAAYSIGELVSLYYDREHGKTAEEIGFINQYTYSSLDKNGKCIYQSLARAARSLERKGFIKRTWIELGYSPNIPEEERTLLGYKAVGFNDKCLANGTPWQLRYLNKRLGGKI